MRSLHAIYGIVPFMLFAKVIYQTLFKISAISAGIMDVNQFPLAIFLVEELRFTPFGVMGRTVVSGSVKHPVELCPSSIALNGDGQLFLLQVALSEVLTKYSVYKVVAYLIVRGVPAGRPDE